MGEGTDDYILVNSQIPERPFFQSVVAETATVVLDIII